MKLPKISIITPTFNSSRDIKTCLESVTRLDYANIEFILIDNCSSDNTLEIIEKFQKEYSFIKVISEPDRGIYDAMNKGIDICTGDWIIFMGSDDEFYDSKVLTKIFTDPLNKACDVLYGNVKFKVSERKYDGKFSAYKLTQRNICHQAIFVRKSVFSKLGKFEIKYSALADWEFNMRWYNDKEIKFRYINIIVAVFNEEGFGFRKKDTEFIKDRALLVNKYFASFTRFVYRKRNAKIYKSLIQVFYKV